ncbi:MAG: hypothetical protein AAB405_02995 [Patescibacteria group bacterium]
MQSYINEKQQKRKKLIFKIKIYSSFILLSFIIIGIAYVIIYSPLFRIKNINKGVLKGDIQDYDKIISDLELFFVTRSKITSILGTDNILIWENKTDDFLKHQSIINNLTIKKDYLNRTININIDSRQKFGVFCSSIECWWFDKEGIILKKAPKIEGEIIYKINDLSEKKLEIGEIVLTKKLFDNAIKIFKASAEVGLNIKTLNIDNFTLQEAYIESASIPRIYFSLRFAPNFNTTIFQNLKEIGLQKIEYIDLRVENRVYYKLK